MYLSTKFVSGIPIWLTVAVLVVVMNTTTKTMLAYPFVGKQNKMHFNSQREDIKIYRVN